MKSSETILRHVDNARVPFPAWPRITVFAIRREDVDFKKHPMPKYPCTGYFMHPAQPFAWRNFDLSDPNVMSQMMEWADGV